MKYFRDLENLRFKYAENVKQSITNWHRFNTKISRKTLFQTFQVIYIYTHIYIYIYIYIYVYMYIFIFSYVIFIYNIFKKVALYS
jgi:hypothetical protein